jgi:peptidoglycan glycosyltransferase
LSEPRGRLSTGLGRARRNTELGLIILAVVVTVSLYILASFARDASLPVNIGPFLLIVLGLLCAAHLANRRFAPNADGVLLPIAGLLNGIGYVFIARLDEDLAGLQATWTAVGIGAYIGTLVVIRRTRVLERYRYTFMLIGIVLLLLPLAPVVGRSINGARIWVSFGPVNFQPGEFAKLALAIFFAGYLVEKRELLAVMKGWGPLSFPDPKHLGPVLVAWGFSLLVMITQKDLGSSLLFFAVFLVMIWVPPSGPATSSSASGSSPWAPTSRGRSSHTSRSESRTGSTRGRTSTAKASRSPRPCSPSGGVG